MLERLARDKRSSLLQKFLNYVHKKFYNIGPRSTPDRCNVGPGKTKSCFKKQTFSIIQLKRVKINMEYNDLLIGPHTLQPIPAMLGLLNKTFAR
jgi:hypothetical protein